MFWLLNMSVFLTGQRGERLSLGFFLLKMKVVAFLIRVEQIVSVKVGPFGSPASDLCFPSEIQGFYI